MKKTLLSLATMLLATSAFAADVTYNMSDMTSANVTGTWNETTYKEDGSVQQYGRWQPMTALKLGDYTLTFDQGEAGTAPALYTAKEGSAWTIRMYNGSKLTVSSTTDLTTVKFVSDKTDDKMGSPSVGAGAFDSDTKTYTWAAPADGAKEVTFSFTGTFRITEIVFSSDAADIPETPSTSAGFDVDFTTSMGGFTFEQGTLPEGLSYVWAQDSKYGLKASAYLNGIFTTDAWAISPVVDLTGAEEPKLAFRYAINNFKVDGTNIAVAEVLKFISVNVREEGGEWVALTIPTLPDSQSWTFLDSGDIDLSAYIGKKIQIGFHYTSDATCAGTWEIDSAALTMKGGSTPDTPETPETPTDFDLLVNNADEIDGTFVEEKAAEGDNYATAAHWQPLTSCLIGEYYFTFSNTNEEAQANQQPALYLPLTTSASGNSNLRMYKGCTMTIEAPQNVLMTAIAMDYSNADSGLAITANNGTVNFDTTAKSCSWTNAEGANKVTFTFDKKIRFYGFAITTSNSGSVDGIELDGAAAEYYTLQGLKVAEPTNGLYIMVVNGKATKVLIRK